MEIHQELGRLRIEWRGEAWNRVSNPRQSPHHRYVLFSSSSFACRSLICYTSSLHEMKCMYAAADLLSLEQRSFSDFCCLSLSSSPDFLKAKKGKLPPFSSLSSFLRWSPTLEMNRVSSLWSSIVTAHLPSFLLRFSIIIIIWPARQSWDETRGRRTRRFLGLWLVPILRPLIHCVSFGLYTANVRFLLSFW